MKSRRCHCGRKIYPHKRTTLKFYPSGGACDAYDCPHYTSGIDDSWSYHISPQSPQYVDHVPSRSEKTDYSISVFQFLCESLAKSSVNGISNCFSTSGVIGKILWILVFSVCVTGFSYQTYHFYCLYQRKPSVVQIEVENDGEVDFPSITICSTNRIRRSAYCRYFPENCKTGTETLTEYQINELMYKLMLRKDDNIKRDLGHSKEMFVDCDFIGTPSVEGQECVDIFEILYDPDYGNCYTFTSKTKNDVHLQARKVDFWQEENELSLEIDLQPEEFMEKKRTLGAIVVIHDKNNLPDIHTDGVLIMAGSSYTISVSKSTVVLLPLPYKTNCTDYLSLPWKNLHRRRLTSRLCTAGCSQYYQFQKCNYVTKNLSLFYKVLPFTQEDETQENLKCAEEEEKRTVNYCRSICGLPCRDSVFTPTVGVSALSEKELRSMPEHHNHPRNMTFSNYIIHARIFYSTLEHKIYRHIPKYNTMELVSFLGGYSGVWLGFSLLTAYELLEIVVSTVIYFFQKLMNRRQYKKISQTVMNTKKHGKTAIKIYKKQKHYR